MSLAQHFPLKVTDDGAGLRLDQFLVSRFAEVSRSQWQDWILEGLVMVDSKSVKASFKMKEGMTIDLAARIKEPKPAAQAFLGEAPRIVFEDEDLLVIDKPAGLTVHPGSGVQEHETLVGWLRENKKLSEDWKLQEDDEDENSNDNADRPGIVHRLDRGTSGLMVVARNRKAHAFLAEQFADRRAGRKYFALTKKSPNDPKFPSHDEFRKLLEKAPIPVVLKRTGREMTFVSFLERDPVARIRFRVSPSGQGKKAITHFHVISESPLGSLLEVELETGRTHQIRIHLSCLGLAIMGDEIYGGGSYERMMLHAFSLHFIHPRTQKEQTFTADWPEPTNSQLRASGLAWHV